MYKIQIVEQVRALLELHPSIESTNYGAEFDVNINGNDLYPLVFIETESSNINVTANVNEHSIALYFLDKHTEDEKITVLEKQKIMERIMLEFLSYMDEEPISNLTIGESRSALSLYEFESDILAGWRLEVTFLTPSPINRCNLNAVFSGSMDLSTWQGL